MFCKNPSHFGIWWHILTLAELYNLENVCNVQKNRLRDGIIARYRNGTDKNDSFGCVNNWQCDGRPAQLFPIRFLGSKLVTDTHYSAQHVFHCNAIKERLNQMPIFVRFWTVCRNIHQYIKVLRMNEHTLPLPTSTFMHWLSFFIPQTSKRGMSRRKLWLAPDLKQPAKGKFESFGFHPVNRCHA